MKKFKFTTATLYLLFSASNVLGQDIGPKPPPEAYKKVLEEFHNKYDFLLKEISINNYKEKLVYLKNSDTPIAINVKFNLNLPEGGGAINLPLIEVVSNLYSKKGLKSLVAIPLMFMNPLELHQSKPTKLSSKSELKLSYTFPFASELFSYSENSNKVCVLKDGFLTRILYPDKIIQEIDYLETKISFPFTPDFEQPRYYLWGFIPISYRGAKFELDLGSILKHVVPKESILFRHMELVNFINRLDIKKELNNANYQLCSNQHEEQDNIQYSKECFCS